MNFKYHLISGQKFSRLTVIEKDTSDPKKKQNWYICACECGKILSVKGCLLVSENRKSCGCLIKDKAIELGRKNKLSNGNATFNRLISSYKTGARTRRFLCNLLTEDFVRLFAGNCFYCGAAPKLYRAYGAASEFPYNGIDRFDNTRGYDLDNVVSCCYQCNRAKGTMTFQEFREWIDTLCSYQVNLPFPTPNNENFLLTDQQQET